MTHWPPTPKRNCTMLVILLPPPARRVGVTVAAVLAALALAGAISARIGGSSRRLAVTRVLIRGAAGLALTYGIGHLFGTAIAQKRAQIRT